MREEVALRILELYVKHVAGPLTKRKMTLDALIAMYNYIYENVETEETVALQGKKEEEKLI